MRFSRLTVCVPLVVAALQISLNAGTIGFETFAEVYAYSYPVVQQNPMSLPYGEPSIAEHGLNVEQAGARAEVELIYSSPLGTIAGTAAADASGRYLSASTAVLLTDYELASWVQTEWLYIAGGHGYYSPSIAGALAHINDEIMVSGISGLVDLAFIFSLTSHTTNPSSDRVDATTSLGVFWGDTIGEWDYFDTQGSVDTRTVTVTVRGVAAGSKIPLTFYLDTRLDPIGTDYHHPYTGPVARLNGYFAVDAGHTATLLQTVVLQNGVPVPASITSALGTDYTSTIPEPRSILLVGSAISLALGRWILRH